MDCRTAWGYMSRFLDYHLDYDTTEELIAHTEECGDCREELEIQFTLHKGLRQLEEDDFEDANYPEAFRKRIRQTRRILSLRRRVQIVKYVLATLTFWAVFWSLVLQIRIWIQTGFFG